MTLFLDLEALHLQEASQPNLIYAITCKTCGIQYVGQTLGRLQDRFRGHYNDIENNYGSVGRHFNEYPLH